MSAGFPLSGDGVAVAWMALATVPAVRPTGYVGKPDAVSEAVRLTGYVVKPDAVDEAVAK